MQFVGSRICRIALRYHPLNISCHPFYCHLQKTCLHPFLHETQETQTFPPHCRAKFPSPYSHHTKGIETLSTPWFSTMSSNLRPGVGKDFWVFGSLPPILLSQVLRISLTVPLRAIIHFFSGSTLQWSSVPYSCFLY